LDPQNTPVGPIFPAEDLSAAPRGSVG